MRVSSRLVGGKPRLLLRHRTSCPDLRPTCLPLVVARSPYSRSRWNVLEYRTPLETNLPRRRRLPCPLAPLPIFFPPALHFCVPLSAPVYMLNSGPAARLVTTPFHLSACGMRQPECAGAAG